MRYRPLGKSGLSVSVLSFGAWQLGDPDFWGIDPEADAERTVAMALDSGINLFDTAEMYGGGESERALGQILGKRRDDILIASKVSPENCSPEKLRQSCEDSLRRLNTDHIDIYQIHWPSRQTPFDDAHAEMLKLKEEGKIRHIGLSNFGPQDLKAWVNRGQSVSNQIGYNILFRAPEYEAIPECRRNNLGILVYMPLMQGLLAGRYAKIEEIPVMRRRTRHFSGHREGTQHGEPGHEEVLMDTLEDLAAFASAVGLSLSVMCLAWLVAQPGVSSVIMGSRNPEQLRKNLMAGDLNIGPAAVAQLNEISFPLKRSLGANCDMWRSEQSSRIQ